MGIHSFNPNLLGTNHVLGIVLQTVPPLAPSLLLCKAGEAPALKGFVLERRKQKNKQTNNFRVVSATEEVRPVMGQGESGRGQGRLFWLRRSAKASLRSKQRPARDLTGEGEPAMMVRLMW